MSRNVSIYAESTIALIPLLSKLESIGDLGGPRNCIDANMRRGNEERGVNVDP